MKEKVHDRALARSTVNGLNTKKHRQTGRQAEPKTKRYHAGWWTALVIDQTKACTGESQGCPLPCRAAGSALAGEKQRNSQVEGRLQTEQASGEVMHTPFSARNNAFIGVWGATLHCVCITLSGIIAKGFTTWAWVQTDNASAETNNHNVWTCKKV